MNAEENCIKTLYESLARRNGEAMAACYHENCTFEDPVFKKLQGDEVRNMWRMLTKRAKHDIKVTIAQISATGHQGFAQVLVEYSFSKTNRLVQNNIKAAFEFKDAKILHQHDYFDFWKWSSMALGTTGILLGWTPYLQAKVQGNARKSLETFTDNLQN